MKPTIPKPKMSRWLVLLLGIVFGAQVCDHAHAHDHVPAHATETAMHLALEACEDRPVPYEREWRYFCVKAVSDVFEWQAAHPFDDEFCPRYARLVVKDFAIPDKYEPLMCHYHANASDIAEVAPTKEEQIARQESNDFWFWVCLSVLWGLFFAMVFFVWRWGGIE